MPIILLVCLFVPGNLRNRLTDFDKTFTGRLLMIEGVS